MKATLVLLITVLVCSCTLYTYKKDNEGCSVTIISWRDLDHSTLNISEECEVTGAADGVRTSEATKDVIIEAIRRAP